MFTNCCTSDTNWRVRRSYALINERKVASGKAFHALMCRIPILSPDKIAKRD